MATLRSCDAALGRFQPATVRSDLAYFVAELQIRRATPPPKKSAKPFLNKTDIIAWQIQGWGCASGPFTLWNGTTGLYEDSHHYLTSFPYTVIDEHGV